MKKVYRLQSRTAEKRQHFGIRRLKVGVASIAISASVFLVGNVLAQAEEANSVENTSIETVQPTSPTSEQSDKVEVTNHQAVVSEKSENQEQASHHKPGKGNTVMRMKLRDVRTGSTFDTTYRPEEKFEQAIIETRPAQYLYQMDDTAYFMDTESFEQYEIPVANVEQELKFILENSEVKIQFYGSEVIGVTVPTTVELVVTDTQPSIKGATVTGSGKPATLETGLVVNVPDFIEVGQKLIINTQEGTYISRA